MNTYQNIGEKTMYEIPNEIPKFTNRFDPASYIARSKYIEDGMFAFVSWKWINPFVEWINNRKCLEVMAGRGILASALRQKGVSVIATDDFSWSKLEHGEYKKWEDTVTEVENLDAVKAVEKYGKEAGILIMSWAYMDDTAYRVIKKLNEVNPDALIVYIGESQGGCTADDEFFKHFDEIEDDEKFNVVSRSFERWQGLHDYPCLGKFK